MAPAWADVALVRCPDLKFPHQLSGPATARARFTPGPAGDTGADPDLVGDGGSLSHEQSCA